MEKINFENKPSTNTPINANNLNLLQDNIEDEFDIKDAEIGDLNSLNTTDKSNLVNAINEVNGIAKGDLLWQNQNQSSNFNSQTIYLSISNYDLIEIIFNEGGNCRFRIGNTGYAYILQDANGNFTGSPYVYLRRIAVTNSGIEFGDCRGQNTSQSGTWATNNARLKPYYIIGFKINLE